MYNWATNQLKLQRALAANPGQPESVVREWYVKIGGRLANGELEEVEATQESEPIVVEELKETENEVPVQAEPVAPKKRKAKFGK